MPLSFCPGKTDEQLLTGIAYMRRAKLMTTLSPAQIQEYDAWLDSDNVRRIARENTAKMNWGMGFALWMKANLLVAFVVIMVLKPVPLNGTDPTRFIGWWLLIAGLASVAAPLKARAWWFWLLYACVIAITFAMTGLL